MTCPLEYHDSVRLRIAPTVAVFGLFLLAFLVPGSSAQINGVPASVTSPGFGGRAINGTPASVTSLGPNGFTPRFSIPAGVQFFTTVPRHDFDFDHDRHHHRHTGNFFPVFGGVYPMYVPVPYPVEAETYADDDSEYQGGPTIFDRRGRGEESYIPPVKDPPPAHAEQHVDSTPPPPEPPQEPTLLVFKDGHQLELGNYAIVGQTLFDLAPGHARRIAIADLDLDATQKKNDERGVTFQLPAIAQVN
jgi:hypothetical protein